jgi:hypothetical protein
MEGRTWLAMLGRWLQPVAPEATPTSVGVREVPAGTRLLEPKSGKTTNPDHPGNILIAMIHHGESQQPSERVHRGHYLVADPECCILVGDEGVCFIPWEAIAWVRT